MNPIIIYLLIGAALATLLQLYIGGGLKVKEVFLFIACALIWPLLLFVAVYLGVFEGVIYLYNTYGNAYLINPKKDEE
jgi:hypothetical protein